MSGDIVYNPAKYRSLGQPGGVASSLANGATGTTATVSATLTPSSTKQAFMTGLSVNRTAGAGAAVTITGLATGETLAFSQGGGGEAPLVVTFDPPIPGNGFGGAIAVNSLADATGANVAVSVWGFQA